MSTNIIGTNNKSFIANIDINVVCAHVVCAHNVCAVILIKLKLIIFHFSIVDDHTGARLFIVRLGLKKFGKRIKSRSWGRMTKILVRFVET